MDRDREPSVGLSLATPVSEKGSCASESRSKKWHPRGEGVGEIPEPPASALRDIAVLPSRTPGSCTHKCPISLGMQAGGELVFVCLLWANWIHNEAGVLLPGGFPGRGTRCVGWGEALWQWDPENLSKPQISDRQKDIPAS